MKIKDKIACVYDIEVFPNCFHDTIYDTESKTYTTFEISERKCQLHELCSYYTENNDKLLVGYNNHHYDDVIINYLIMYKDQLNGRSWSEICRSIFNLSKTLTSDLEPDNKTLSSIKHIKYANIFDSMDLMTMLFSQKLAVSLKAMQMTMHYKNVQEYSGDFNLPIPLDKIDEMIGYNKNDVDSTAELLTMKFKEVKLRLFIEQEYGINALSMDSVKFGETILLNRYCAKTGLPEWQVKQMRSPMDYVPLKDVIFDFISYKNPTLRSVLEDMREQVVYTKERKGYEKKFVLSNMVYSVGVGGIHSINTPGIFLPKDDEFIGHADVTSLYPSLLIKYGLTPRHLGKEFLDTYTQIYYERVEAKRSGQDLKNKALKLTLNSVTGKMQQDVSWMYDPFNVFRIRINGQLILLMLVERLLDLGCEIIQVNTDGVMYIGKKSIEDSIGKAISDIEHLSKLSFDVGRYRAFYQYAVNDYFGILEDETVEEKGMFITKTVAGKGLAPTIIPKAVINYFKTGQPIKDFIISHTDIKDFLIGQRVDKKFKVVYGDKPVNRINRFYASTNGFYLYKTPDGISYNKIVADSGITILNKFDDIPIENRKINYDWYIRKASKIVQELQTVQLTLF